MKTIPPPPAAARTIHEQLCRAPSPAHAHKASGRPHRWWMVPLSGSDAGLPAAPAAPARNLSPCGQAVTLRGTLDIGFDVRSAPRFPERVISGELPPHKAVGPDSLYQPSFRRWPLVDQHEQRRRLCVSGSTSRRQQTRSHFYARSNGTNVGMWWTICAVENF